MARAKIDRSASQIQDGPIEEQLTDEVPVTDGDRDGVGGGRNRSIRMPRVRTVVAALIVGLLVGGVAAVGILRGTPVFLSKSILLIDQPLQITGQSGEGVIAKLNQLRLKYAILAHTPKFASDVAKRVGLSDRDVAGRINVTLPGPSLVLVMEGRSGDKRKARVIANGASAAMVDLVKAEMDANKIEEKYRIVMTLVAPAQAGAKVEPSQSRATAIGAISGLLALTATFVLAELVRQRSASR